MPAIWLRCCMCTDKIYHGTIQHTLRRILCMYSYLSIIAVASRMSMVTFQFIPNPILTFKSPICIMKKKASSSEIGPFVVESGWSNCCLLIINCMPFRFDKCLLRNATRCSSAEKTFIRVKVWSASTRFSGHLVCLVKADCRRSCCYLKTILIRKRHRLSSVIYKSSFLLLWQLRFVWE